jgi:RNA 2',3'-cyclic 3'-phosphodiesterase
VARLFVSVRLPIDVQERLEELPRPDEPGVRWVPAHQWHITLRFLGDAAATTVAERLDSARLPSATARLGPVVSRLGRDVVVLPVEGLGELAAVVAAATADLGTPPDPRPFRGHLTLARLRHRAACGIAGARFHAEFAVPEVELVSSTLHPTGATHHPLTHHPLPPPPN